MKSAANHTLPRTARGSLAKLGEDIAVARKKRRISTVSMAGARLHQPGHALQGGTGRSDGFHRHLRHSACPSRIRRGTRKRGRPPGRHPRTGYRRRPLAQEDHVLQTRETPMNDLIEVHIDCGGGTCLVGRCRYFARRSRQSSVFEYANEWLDRPDAFAIDPANLPLKTGPFYTSSEKSALPGALRDTAPDRWGRLLVQRALCKHGQVRTLSEIDYLLAMTDRTRTGALRYQREGEDLFGHDTVAWRVPPIVRLSVLTGGPPL